MLESVSFSMHKQILFIILVASGSIDQTVNLWDLTTGKVVMTYKGSCSGIFEVDWNQRGDRLAASSGDGTVRQHLS